MKRILIFLSLITLMSCSSLFTEPEPLTIVKLSPDQQFFDELARRDIPRRVHYYKCVERLFIKGFPENQINSTCSNIIWK